MAQCAWSRSYERSAAAKTGLKLALDERIFVANPLSRESAMSNYDPAQLTAADVMTAAPRTCSPFSTVLEAVLIFRDADCGAVPVIKDGTPVGLLTDRDVALAVADHGDNLTSLPVSELMSQGIVSVTPETTLSEIIDKLSDKGIRRLLVVDGKSQLVGIIGLADLAPHVPNRSLGHAVTEVIEHA